GWGCAWGSLGAGGTAEAKAGAGACARAGFGFDFGTQPGLSYESVRVANLPPPRGMRGRAMYPARSSSFRARRMVVFAEVECQGFGGHGDAVRE
ncbi:hypothetical protein, partial [Streptomyces venezuelae]|uniref:hypothetical protein n=1 Tax=Streptomyces venezuelae TaxID=54571 RepID=UPI001F23D63C